MYPDYTGRGKKRLSESAWGIWGAFPQNPDGERPFAGKDRVDRKTVWRRIAGDGGIAGEKILLSDFRIHYIITEERKGEREPDQDEEVFSMKRRLMMWLPVLCLCLAVLCLNASAAGEGYALHRIDPGDGGVAITLTAEQPCTLAAAVYDGDGRMLDANTAAAPAGAGISVPVPLDLSAGEVKEVKAFLLDGKTGAPLCRAETVDPTAPTEVYAVQSEDGKTLTFYNTLPEGVSLEDGNVWQVEDYVNDTGMKDEDYDRPVLHPWSGDTLDTVVFAERVCPTSTAYWFERCGGLTSVLGIENLDTSRAVSMRMMFYYCYNLPALDVSGFDTSRVTDMSGMFNCCEHLKTLDVSGFDTSRVTDMHEMFYSCYGLKALDVSGFDTSRVTDMGGMFNCCGHLKTLDVSGFDTSRVTDMSGMFYGCSGLKTLDVSGFDTSRVKKMADMFCFCYGLKTLDVSGFNTSRVTNMRGMFSVCRALTSLDVSGFDTSRVTNMSEMFGCESLTSLDVSKFNTSKVTNMSGMFSDCKSLTTLDVSGFDTSRVTKIGGMFAYCESLLALDLSGFDTSRVKDMERMFENCGSLIVLDLSAFDTSQVKSMYGMFNECEKLRTIYVSPAFVTEQLSFKANVMFYRCFNLVGGSGKTFDGAHQDSEYARIDLPGRPGYFTEKQPA